MAARMRMTMPQVGTPSSLPGSVPGSLPGSVPGSVPGSLPGSFPGSVPGSVPGSAAAGVSWWLTESSVVVSPSPDTMDGLVSDVSWLSVCRLVLVPTAAEVLRGVVGGSRDSVEVPVVAGVPPPGVCPGVSGGVVPVGGMLEDVGTAVCKMISLE